MSFLEILAEESSSEDSAIFEVIQSPYSNECEYYDLVEGCKLNYLSLIFLVALTKYPTEAAKGRKVLSD